MANKYTVIKSDAGNGLIEGKTITPYYEDDNEIIINGVRSDMDHHIRKSSKYFTEHLQPAGGK